MKNYLILTIALIFASCSSSRNEEAFKQSVELHELALKIGQQAEEKLTLLSAQADAMDSLEQVSLVDSVKSIRDAIGYWKSTIVEVPGHEHDHHDHEGHDHNHGPSDDLTPEMVLEIQQDLVNRAEKLDGRVSALLNAMEISSE